MAPEEQAIRTWKELAKFQGIAVCPLNDGHMVILTREFLEKLLREHPDQPQMIVYLKQAQGQG